MDRTGEQIPSQSLAGKHILLGVTGGIAAYKSADLVRRLAERGAEVRVVMTVGAQAFVTPLTFQAVSGNPVHTQLLDETAEAGMGHIELARWADLVLIAPCSADFMARLSHGLADDLLATLCLATTAPICLAPSMNSMMWSNAATQDNAATLCERGIELFGPGAGEQACGEVGPGRMLEPLDLVTAMEARLMATDCLPGARVLVTAGPTYEDLDPVRYLGNRSSGKMGFAVATAAQRAGASVTLIAGPVALTTPPGIERVDVRSATEMHAAVIARAEHCDIFISVAAVADFRPSVMATEKIKKGEAVTMALELRRNPDILAAVAGQTTPPFTVGFAAETTALEINARGKLQRKGLDMICANPVGAADSGFDGEHNTLTVLWEGGEHQLTRATKNEVARQLVECIAERWARKRAEAGVDRWQQGKQAKCNEQSA